MDRERSLIPIERVQETILIIRDQKVILDGDLAKLYGVPTKRLNEQVKRNRDRFPDDFMFELTTEEKAEVVANCDPVRTLETFLSFTARFHRAGCGYAFFCSQ